MSNSNINNMFSTLNNNSSNSNKTPKFKIANKIQPVSMSGNVSVDKYRKFIILVTIVYFFAKLWYKLLYNLITVLPENEYTVKDERHEINDFIITLILTTITFAITNMHTYTNYIILLGIAIGAQLPIIIKLIDKNAENTGNDQNNKNTTILKAGLLTFFTLFVFMLNIIYAPTTKNKLIYAVIVTVGLIIIVLMIKYRHKKQYIEHNVSFILWIISLTVLYNDENGAVEFIHGVILGALIGSISYDGIKYFLRSSLDTSVHNCNINNEIKVTIKSGADEATCGISTDNPLVTQLLKRNKLNTNSLIELQEDIYASKWIQIILILIITISVTLYAYTINK
jgi:hypothetical protein